ncbi:MAG: radical SAM protein, partial [Terracidiphilus sp.]
YVYLQFDGIGNAANSHRKVGNLFDVKLQAINNLHEAGVEIVPVTTIVNGINNEQVGRIIEFALDNPRKISFLSFQPVSFTGRDEDITEERRVAQRYTLSHMAHDVKSQVGIGEPARDWFPISFMSTFSDWADLVHGPTAEWGQLSCGCHPNCGIGMAVMIDKETKESAPVTAFLHMDQVAKDLAKVNDAARGKWMSVIGLGLSLMRNYDPFQAPTHFRITDMMKKMDKTFNATGKNYGSVKGDRTIEDIKLRRQDRWNFLFIAGMWFQDLFNYDFRRTEQCIIPYATQEGEISFCAYNTGVGWRNIIEKMHMTATLTKWYEEHGRHEIFAGGKKVGMTQVGHDLQLNMAHVNAEANHTLDNLGIAKNAREEKIRARDEKVKAEAENARMAKLYREHVLGEKPVEGLVSLGDIKPASNNATSPINRRQQEGELVSGD